MKHVLNIIQYSITKMFRDNVKRLIKSLSTFFYQVTLMFCVLMNVVAFETNQFYYIRLNIHGLRILGLSFRFRLFSFYKKNLNIIFHTDIMIILCNLQISI